jgi:hypothetical protein
MLLKFIAALCHQSKQRVIVASINPSIIGQGRAHAAAGATAVASTAGITLKKL